MRPLEHMAPEPLDARALASKLGSAVRFLILSTASTLLLTVVAIVMFLVACVTGFQTQRWLREVAARRLGRVILSMWGVRVELHQDEPWPSTQVIY